MSAALGQSGIPVIILASASEDCVLLQFALKDISEAALAKKRAQARA